MVLIATPHNVEVDEDEQAKPVSSRPVGPTQLTPLTGLRFFAALWVVVYHFGQVPASFQPLYNIIACGYLGVDFFFILSGFILAYTYLDANGQMQGSRHAFWVARFARIYPVYLLSLLIAPFPFFPPHDVAMANPLLIQFSATTLTQAWFPFSATVWNPPGWSLSVEVFFYLMFPLLVLPVFRCTRRFPAMTLAAVWMICLLPRLAYIIIDPAHVGPHWDADTWWARVVSMMPIMRLPEFLLGISLAIIFVQARSRGRRPPGYLAPVALAILLGLLSLGPHTLGPLLSGGLLDPFFASLIYGLAWQRGRIAAALAVPAITLLGEASYALYILHFPLWSRMTGTTTGVLLAEKARPFSFVALYLIVAIGISLLSHRFVERPARRAIRNAYALLARARAARVRSAVASSR